MYASNQLGMVAANSIGAAEQTRSPEIPHLLDRLEHAIAHLDDRTSLLDSRMSGAVARSDATNQATAGVPKAVVNTGMGQALDVACDRVGAIAARVQSLIERLEF